MNEKQWKNNEPRWDKPARYTIKIGKGHFTGSCMVHRIIAGPHGPTVDQIWVGMDWEAAIALVDNNLWVERHIQVHRLADR